MADSSTYTIRLAGGVAQEVFSSVTKLREEVTHLAEGFKQTAELIGVGLGARELIELGKQAIEATTAPATSLSSFPVA